MDLQKKLSTPDRLIGGKTTSVRAIDGRQGHPDHLTNQVPLVSASRKDFPLFAHRNGQWCKKIKGRQHYFGVWADPDAALNLYLDQRDDLAVGRTPRTSRDGLLVRDLLNRFLTAQESTIKSGELGSRTFTTYLRSCKIIAEAFGKNRLADDLATDDFERLRNSLTDTLGPVALGNEVQRTRGIFKYAYDCGLIDRQTRFGPGFKKPPAKTIRLARNARGPRMFEADEIRTMLDSADSHLKAMVLLALNCGFGNSDVGRLNKSVVDLDGGWVNFARPKTGVERRCPLWLETTIALKASLAERTQPKKTSHADLFFVTTKGNSWAKQTSDNPVSATMVRLLRRLGLHRPGRSFYALRHTFATVAGASLDQVAVNAIMGHADPSMAGVYRERIDDERLTAVTDHVRHWLWPNLQDSSNGSS